MSLPDPTTLHPDTVRDRLRVERDRLHDLVGSLEEIGVTSLDGSFRSDQHPADSGTETFERSRDSSIQRQIEGQLADLERAWGRLDDGTYGTCEACGRPVGEERLVARPSARFCLDDQRISERGAREAVHR